MDGFGVAFASGSIQLSGRPRCYVPKNNVPAAGNALESGLIATGRGTYPMSNLKHINGIVPIIPTPFTRKEEVDWSALRKLVTFARDAGACAGCLPAYASEFYKLAERERRQIVTEAVQHADGRLPIIAQVNYPGLREALENTKFAQEAGADAVSIAVPRLFQLPESDLLRYFDRILGAIDIPVLIQDYNPSGPTVSARFAAELHRQHPHFRYLKLEEPMMSAKIEAILQETGGEVGVLEGWGGMYMLELIPAGICGVMPGLAVADLLARVFHLASHGEKAQAYPIFAEVLPQIAYSLQHMELFHHAEKRLLEARGILETTHVRDAGIALRAADADHIDFLNSRILALLDRLGMPHNPPGRLTEALAHTR
jgi:dihydrodipicolinate synthase/N-acetylneuraminate lyase